MQSITFVVMVILGGMGNTIGVILAAVLLTLVDNETPLWLDETLSVNIARLPLTKIPQALSHDGAPPLYYVLLHFWIRVFGDGDVAVRALADIPEAELVIAGGPEHGKLRGDKAYRALLRLARTGATFLARPARASVRCLAEASRSMADSIPSR